MRRDKKAGGGGAGEGAAAAAADDEEAVAFTITPTLESLICVYVVLYCIVKECLFHCRFFAVGQDCVFSFCFLLFVRSWRRKVYNPFCFSFW